VIKISIFIFHTRLLCALEYSTVDYYSLAQEIFKKGACLPCRAPQHQGNIWMSLTGIVRRGAAVRRRRVSCYLRTPLSVLLVGQLREEEQPQLGLFKRLT